MMRTGQSTRIFAELLVVPNLIAPCGGGRKFGRRESYPGWGAQELISYAIDSETFIQNRAPLLFELFARAHTQTSPIALYQCRH